MSEPRDLVLVTDAARMLAEAQTFDDIRNVLNMAEAARRYARKARLGLDAQNQAATISLEAQAKADAALAAAREAGQLADQGGDRRSKLTESTLNLDDLGVSRNEAAAWAKVADVPAEIRSAYVAQATQAEQEVTRAGLLRFADFAQKASGDGLMSSSSPEWYTPRHVVDAVVQTLGAIDLDPCSDPGKSIPATSHFTEADDGLSRTWKGRVYMNPPYGKTIGEWTSKLRREHDEGSVTAAIALVPARTETDWWATIDAEWVCLIHGRLSFSESANSAPFPSAVLYLGPEPECFAAAFLPLGPVYRRVG